MNRILIPIGTDSAQSERQVETLLSLTDRAEVMLVHVHEEIDTPTQETGSHLVEEINRNIKEIQGVPDSVESARVDLDQAGFDVQYREIIADDTADAILESARDFEADAILLGGGTRSPVGKAVFGSLTQTVALDSDRPVILSPRSL